MSLILNIDTSLENAGVCLAKDGLPLIIAENKDQKDHAAWLHVSIKKMIEEAGYKMQNLDAIGIASGPGSYTGLRVGMAAAKGFCYALKIPLITIGTLYLIAFAVRDEVLPDSLICPMIDARRMEVFTALYNIEMKEVMKPSALILNKNSFEDYFFKQHIFFAGNGSKKWKEVVQSSNASFLDTPILASYLAQLSHNKYLTQEFTDLIYSEPIYLKEFYTHEKK
ncbi:MAG: tRNA (adenosine(37)-N6)-threonylcarbamoyltransferase complex dimerization subunit type 1 TsaB [Bacteroidetes bacterium]|nr:tRNA (adenosine(37)-N6)-threonylcarbamoyltransferase complex dimerization subunit type 1 TsaB [Bacteroidota bacterium]